MSEKNKRIADLPSYRELSTALSAARMVWILAGLAIRTGLGGDKAQRIMESANEFLSHSDILELPDQFNAAFTKHGWIATSSLSVEVMRAALKQYNKGDLGSAESILLDWLTPEVISLFAIRRSKSFSTAHSRWDQLREALALTQEGRYWAAVPLILIASDGLASDILGTSPFEKNADLTAFDSMVGHPTSLPALIGQITKGVRKSNDEPLTIPLRHGILHGRSLGYANRAVCGKAWMFVIALLDWAVDKQREGTRQAKDRARRSRSWNDVWASVHKNHADKQALEAFSTLHWNGPFDLGLVNTEPPHAFQVFLSGWKAQNYGAMAKRAVNINGQKLSQLAGRMRLDAELVQLDEFEILSVTQTTIARAEARVRMLGQTFTRKVSGEFLVLAFRHSPSGEIAMPNEEGEWQVQQGCIFDVMNEKKL